MFNARSMKATLYSTTVLTAFAFLGASQAVAAVGTNEVPTNGTVNQGSATISQPFTNGSNQTQLNVTQNSSRAVVDWDSFNIGTNGRVDFNQNTGDIIVNRTNNFGSETQILGQLNADSTVFIANPNGVLFGQNARIDVGGILATTGQIDENAFMNGDASFGITNMAGTGSVINNSTDFTVAEAGIAAFVAPHVENNGSIVARMGTVTLAAGRSATVTLDMFGDGLIEIDTGLEASDITNNEAVSNTGSINVDGGTVELTTRQAAGVVNNLINMDGTVQAQDATVAANGSIILNTGDNGGVNVAANADVQTDNLVVDTPDVSVNGAAQSDIASIDVENNNVDLSDMMALISDNGTINLSTGTYDMGASRFNVNVEGVSLIGESEADTILDLSAQDSWGVYITANDVTLSDLTVDGPRGGVDFNNLVWADYRDNYGIKAVGDNLTLTNMTVRGSGNTEIDLNGVDGAQITNVTAIGEFQGMMTPGVGLSAKNSSNIVVDSITTSQNGWGGIGIYDDVEGFTLAGNNDFGEDVPLYTEDDGYQPGDTYSISDLQLSGMEYVVLNPEGRTQGDGQEFVFYFESAEGASDFALQLPNTQEGYIQSLTTDGNGFTVRGNEFLVTQSGTASLSVQTAVDAASEGAVISVAPGDYFEEANDRASDAGGTGPYDYGLYVDVAGLTLQGVDADGNVITDPNNTMAVIEAGNRSAFGAIHFVAADDVTFEGLTFAPVAGYRNKTVEVVGDNFTLRNSVIDNTLTAGDAWGQIAGGLYISDFGDGSRVQSFTVDNNIFNAGGVTLANGAGLNGDASSRVITNNIIRGNEDFSAALLLQGDDPNTAWLPNAVGDVTIDNNVFENNSWHIGVYGGENMPVLNAQNLLDNNSFDTAAIAADAGTGNVRSTNPGDVGWQLVYSSAQSAVDTALDGDQVILNAARFEETLSVDKSLEIIGAGAEQTVIAGDGTSNTVAVQGQFGQIDGFTISDLTIEAPDAAGRAGLIFLSGGVNNPDNNVDNVVVERVIINGQGTNNGSFGIGLNENDTVTIDDVLINDVDLAIEAGGLGGDIVITNVDFDNVNTAMRIFSWTGYIQSDASYSINGNDFEGADLGLQIGRSELDAYASFADLSIDATLNYWGTTDGSAIQSEIQYAEANNGVMAPRADASSYLINGTDQNLDLTGFQPDYSSLGVTTEGFNEGNDRIAQALAALSEGGDLIIEAGDYDEDVVASDASLIFDQSMTTNLNSLSLTDGSLEGVVATDGDIVLSGVSASGDVNLDAEGDIDIVDGGLGDNDVTLSGDDITLEGTTTDDLIVNDTNNINGSAFVETADIDADVIDLTLVAEDDIDLSGDVITGDYTTPDNLTLVVDDSADVTVDVGTLDVTGPNIDVEGEVGGNDVDFAGSFPEGLSVDADFGSEEDPANLANDIQFIDALTGNPLDNEQVANLQESLLPFLLTNLATAAGDGFDGSGFTRPRVIRVNSTNSLEQLLRMEGVIVVLDMNSDPVAVARQGEEDGIYELSVPTPFL